MEKRRGIKINLKAFLPRQAWLHSLELNGVSILVKKGYLGFGFLLHLIDFFSGLFFNWNFCMKAIKFRIKALNFTISESILLFPF